MRILYKFNISHIGWESDTEAWIIEDEKGKRFIKTTSHGKEIEAKEKFLDHKIKEYQDLIRETRKAKHILNYREK